MWPENSRHWYRLLGKLGVGSLTVESRETMHHLCWRKTQSLTNTRTKTVIFLSPKTSPTPHPKAFPCLTDIVIYVGEFLPHLCTWGAKVGLIQQTSYCCLNRLRHLCWFWQEGVRIHSVPHFKSCVGPAQYYGGSIHYAWSCLQLDWSLNLCTAFLKLVTLTTYLGLYRHINSRHISKMIEKPQQWVSII